ncbi:fatty acyl-coa reductase 1 [Phtheirospermum japonicum]|uniref:Fatty acyl-CoA reductase n=1 Tax=Phtheirospermum japonicum TaxID=374723 RepID=A0A830CY97_9LAMI|nr:fatty acyl-coa reductase 1 [Phtheirospermum japonicum]
MGTSRIVQEFEGKTIFITGATGFLAKIVVEKLLRVQPNVKKLLLLIRPSNARSAEQRLHEEIIDSELFRVLRDIWGENISCFLSSKVNPIPGDVSHENLGIINAELVNEICGEIDFIINMAATTRFDERYDVAMDINAFGIMHVLSFAKRCPKLKLLCHVSTAFLHGSRPGLLLEEPFNMGETLKGAKASCLNIDTEKKLVEETRARLQAQNMNEKELTLTLRDLATQRANIHGWANAYSFTKAMGEMLLMKFKENINVIIIRPTIISSTCRDPFPGWIEGLRTLDSIFAAYATGKIKKFLGDPGSIIDVIPGDMVVNSILVAMATHSNTHSRKPINVGKPEILTSITSFRRIIGIRYLPFLKMLKLVNVIFCNHFQDSYTNSKRKINRVMRLAELYEPYLFFQGIFDDANTENLRRATIKNNTNADIMFGFDPKSIDWNEYFIKAHFPGVVKFALMQ